MCASSFDIRHSTFKTSFSIFSRNKNCSKIKFFLQEIINLNIPVGFETKQKSHFLRIAKNKFTFVVIFLGLALIGGAQQWHDYACLGADANGSDQHFGAAFHYMSTCSFFKKFFIFFLTEMGEKKRPNVYLKKALVSRSSFWLDWSRQSN